MSRCRPRAPTRRCRRHGQRAPAAACPSTPSGPKTAFFMSTAHEIEHDTIHRLYFTRNKRAQHVVFAVVWLLRPYAISPWARRPLHLLHHEVSGTAQDLEERGITNGEPWSLKR